MVFWWLRFSIWISVWFFGWCGFGFDLACGFLVGAVEESRFGLGRVFWVRRFRSRDLDMAGHVGVCVRGVVG